MRITELKTFKKANQKIACLTAYDASFTKVFVDCGVDIILVGDSLGNVIHGNNDTLGVSMNDMLYHTKAVINGCDDTLVIVDMPYKSYTNAPQALTNAKHLLATGAQIVKFEGGCEHEAVFKLLHKNNIKICGHLGLQPQSIINPADYKVKGKNKAAAATILKDAQMLESWGVELIILECIPQELAKIISKSLTIPTIGIGSGVHCDGQVLVSYDILGISKGHTPKFVKNFLIDNSDIKGAVKSFVKAVKNSSFPNDKHSY